MFDTGSVTLGAFAAKLMARKGFTWVTKSKKVNVIDAYELTILLWIYDIIEIHWSAVSVDKGGTKIKKIFIVPSRKKLLDQILECITVIICVGLVYLINRCRCGYY